MSTQQLSPTLQRYVVAMVGVGAATTALTLTFAPPHRASHDILLMSMLAGLVVLTYFAPIKLAPKRQLTVSAAFMVVALLTLPLGGAVLSCGLGVAAGNAYQRRPWLNIAFNAAQNALALAAAGLVYVLLSSRAADQGLTRLAALLMAGTLLYLVSALAVDTAAAIQRRCSPFANWRAVRGPTILPHFALVLVGAAAVPAVEHTPWLLLLLAVPVLVVRSMLAISMQFDAATVQVAEAAADAVAAQFPHRRDYLARVVAVSERLSRACELSEEQTRRITLAARLHDVAATASVHPSAIEQALLDDEGHDFHMANAHEGANLIGAALNMPAVAEVLRFHHERFDGRGLPNGIAGEDIPYESAVLALAEAWVGLTSARAQRPALATAQALTVIRAGAGLQWHPGLTEVLVSLIEAEYTAEVAPVQVPAPVLSPVMR